MRLSFNLLLCASFFSVYSLTGRAESGHDGPSREAPAQREPGELNPEKIKVGDRAPNAWLVDARFPVDKGELHRARLRSLINPRKKGTAIVFLGIGCPVGNSYIGALNKLSKDYPDFNFLAVNSSEFDTAADFAEYADDRGLKLPLWKDVNYKLADALGIQKVPSLVLLDSNSRLVYRGAIDNRKGQRFERPKATEEYAKDALSALNNAKRVEKPETQAEGCNLERPAAGGGQAHRFNYAKEIAPIIQKKCAGCHSSGDGPAPFPLLTCRDVRSRASTIRDVVSIGTMPPWHADPRYGKFLYDRSLSASEKEKLLGWLRFQAKSESCEKAEREEKPDVAKQSKQSDEPEWSIGKPDYVFEMPKPFHIPATGNVDYQYYQFNPHLDHDVYITAVEIKPQNKQVIHHALAYVSDGKGEGRSQVVLQVIQGTSSIIGGYAPGRGMRNLPPGTAFKLPKGSGILLEMHYTPTGKEESDQTQIALRVSTKPPEHEIKVNTLMVPILQTFIAAGDPHKVLKKEYTFKTETEIFSFTPHMHLRGKSYRVDLYRKGEKKPETLLYLPRYDFNWQTTYEFEKPVIVGPGDRVVTTGVFDNSAGNPNNPNPKSTVLFSEQTNGEMCVGFMSYAEIAAKAKPSQR